MLQTPGFQQKERKTDLKNDENAGPISGPFGCLLFPVDVPCANPLE